MGNVKPTVALKPFLGAYFTDQTERVINIPQRMEEHKDAIAQFSALSFAKIKVLPKGKVLLAMGEKETTKKIIATPMAFPRKHTGKVQRFFLGILGMSATMPVKSFISKVTMAKIPNEKRIAPIIFPQFAYKVWESKEAVAPTPIIRPEQMASNTNTAMSVFEISCKCNFFM